MDQEKVDHIGNRVAGWRKGWIDDDGWTMMDRLDVRLCISCGGWDQVELNRARNN